MRVELNSVNGVHTFDIDGKYMPDLFKIIDRHGGKCVGANMDNLEYNLKITTETDNVYFDCRNTIFEDILLLVILGDGKMVKPEARKPPVKILVMSDWETWETVEGGPAHIIEIPYQVYKNLECGNIHIRNIEDCHIISCEPVSG